MKNAWRKTDYSRFPDDDLSGTTLLGDRFTANEIAKEEEDKIVIMMDEMVLNEDEEDEWYADAE